jgi:hypothetical protein
VAGVGYDALLAVTTESRSIGDLGHTKQILSSLYCGYFILTVEVIMDGETNIPLGDEAVVPTRLAFTEQESTVLQLYDRLKQLQLEISLLKARQGYVVGMLSFISTCGREAPLSSNILSQAHPAQSKLVMCTLRRSSSWRLGLPGRCEATLWTPS